MACLLCRPLCASCKTEQSQVDPTLLSAETLSGKYWITFLKTTACCWHQLPLQTQFFLITHCTSTQVFKSGFFAFLINIGQYKQCFYSLWFILTKTDWQRATAFWLVQAPVLGTVIMHITTKLATFWQSFFTPLTMQELRHAKECMCCCFCCPFESQTSIQCIFMLTTEPIAFN